VGYALSAFPRFHVSIKGGCVIGISGQEEVVQVEEMEIAMLGQGEEHWIVDRKGRDLIPSEKAGEACLQGVPLFQEGPKTNKLICGLMRFDATVNHPILHSFPKVLHLSKINASSALWRIAETIDAMADEVGSKPSAVMDRLTEALFIEIIKTYTADQKPVGFFAALKDPRLSQALAHLHNDIQEPWTIDMLAQKVGVSRLSLVRQFNTTIGMGPIQYLSQWRMIRAKEMLSNSNASLDLIAEQVGFALAQSFARAFRRQFGISPGYLWKVRS
jgi:AraC-like DNA-binding protein